METRICKDDYRIDFNANEFISFIFKATYDFCLTVNGHSSITSLPQLYSSFKIAKTVEGLAYKLLITTYTMTVEKFIESKRDVKKVKTHTLKNINISDIYLDYDFIVSPGKSKICSIMKECFKQILVDVDYKDEKIDLEINTKWDNIFSYCFMKEWSNHAIKYDQIIGVLNPPNRIGHAELNKYQEHIYWILSMINDPIEGEKFSLGDIYIPLYCQYRDCNENINRINMVEIEISKWIENKQSNMLIVQGEAGSGKSTSLKIIAKEYIEKGKSVVLVNLYNVRFPENVDPVHVIEKYIYEETGISKMNLKEQNNILIILEGIDEIVEDLWENSMKLIQGLRRETGFMNNNIIISGRPKIISYCEAVLENVPIMTVLPLNCEEDIHDLREEYWNILNKNFEIEYDYDEFFDDSRFEELSNMPLLMYLIVWTIKNNDSQDFFNNLTEPNNVAALYDKIIEICYNRDYLTNKTAKSIERKKNYQKYRRLLSIIGFVTYKYSTREIEFIKIKEYCAAYNEEYLLDYWFQNKSDSKKTKIFLTFFAHENINDNNNDLSTFLFIHKTFSEYLAADEIIYRIINQHNNHTELYMVGDKKNDGKTVPQSKEESKIVMEALSLLSEEKLSKSNMGEFLFEILKAESKKCLLFANGIEYIEKLLNESMLTEEGGIYIQEFIEYLNRDYDNEFIVINFINDLYLLRINIVTIIWYLHTNDFDQFKNILRLFYFIGSGLIEEKVVDFCTLELFQANISNYNLTVIYANNISIINTRIERFSITHIFSKELFIQDSTMYNAHISRIEMNKFHIINSDFIQCSFSGCLNYDDRMYGLGVSIPKLTSEIDILESNGIKKLYHLSYCSFFCSVFKKLSYCNEIEIVGCDFHSCKFQNCDFRNINFRSDRFINCRFKECIFPDEFVNCYFEECIFPDKFDMSIYISKNRIIN